MDRLLDWARDTARVGARYLARRLDKWSGGRLTPNSVTLTGLAAHIPIACLIAISELRWAALLLVFFGLFDLLDGALAKVQDSVSARGMLLDQTTDRLKEVIIYTGVAYYLVASNRAFWAVWAVAAVGTSLLVSYINAWGEVAIAKHQIDEHAVNQSFRGGLMRFEVRISVLILGLLFHQLIAATVIVACLSFYTAVARLVMITRRVEEYIARD